MVQSRGAHVMLLEFVAAEDHQALRPVLLQHDFDKFLPERPRPARDQYCLFRPIHPIRLVPNQNQTTMQAETAQTPLVISISTAILGTFLQSDGHGLGLTLPLV